MGTSASNIRTELAFALGVPIKKVLSIIFLGWPAIGGAIEETRFCKFFEIWKTTSDHPLRVFLVAALLESRVSNMIPESLVESFSDGMQRVSS